MNIEETIWLVLKIIITLLSTFGFIIIIREKGGKKQNERKHINGTSKV